MAAINGQGIIDGILYIFMTNHRQVFSTTVDFFAGVLGVKNLKIRFCKNKINDILKNYIYLLSLIT